MGKTHHMLSTRHRPKSEMAGLPDEKTMTNRLMAKEAILKRCLKRYCALRSAVRRQDVTEW